MRYNVLPCSSWSETPILINCFSCYSWQSTFHFRFSDLLNRIFKKKFLFKRKKDIRLGFWTVYGLFTIARHKSPWGNGPWRREIVYRCRIQNGFTPITETTMPFSDSAVAAPFSGQIENLLQGQNYAAEHECVLLKTEGASVAIVSSWRGTERDVIVGSCRGTERDKATKWCPSIHCVKKNKYLLSKLFPVLLSNLRFPHKFSAAMLAFTSRYFLL